MTWIYIAQPGAATSEDTEKLANDFNFIWRNPYNPKSNMVANVRRVAPRDIMLLYFVENDEMMRLLGVYKVLAGNTKHFRAVPETQLNAIYFFGGDLNLGEMGYQEDENLQTRFKEMHAGFAVKKIGLTDIPEELLELPVPKGQNAIRDLDDLVESSTSKDLQRAIDACY